MIKIKATVVKEKETIHNMSVNVMTQEDADLIDGVFKSTLSVLESGQTWMDLSDNAQTLLAEQVRIISKLIEDLEGRMRNLENRDGK